MEQYIKKSALVAEIEKRISVLKANKSVISMLAGGMFVNEFKDLLSFLDTLEVKEIGVDLGDPKGDIGVKTVLDSSNLLEISRHGNRHIGETLEEAATKYARKQLSNPDYPTYNDEYEMVCAFEAGAQWQKEHILDDDNKQYHRLRHETLKRLYENEAKLELMLDNALEGYIEKYEQIGGHNYLSLKIPMLSKPDNCKDDDKIKLIILKEDKL